jgi:hypothetical protein
VVAVNTPRARFVKMTAKYRQKVFDVRAGRGKAKPFKIVLMVIATYFGQVVLAALFYQNMEDMRFIDAFYMVCRRLHSRPRPLSTLICGALDLIQVTATSSVCGEPAVRPPTACSSDGSGLTPEERWRNGGCKCRFVCTGERHHDDGGLRRLLPNQQGGPRVCHLQHPRRL